jgi:hypothetical protein
MAVACADGGPADEPELPRGAGAPGDPGSGRGTPVRGGSPGGDARFPLDHLRGRASSSAQGPGAGKTQGTRAGTGTAPAPAPKPVVQPQAKPAEAKPVEAKPAEPPPAAAQAGKTLTAADDVADFSNDFTLVQGEGRYAGGTTAARERPPRRCATPTPRKEASRGARDPLRRRPRLLPQTSRTGAARRAPPTRPGPAPTCFLRKLTRKGSTTPRSPLP